MDNRSRWVGSLAATLVVALSLTGAGCTFDPAGMPLSSVCGDGVATGGEECDVSDLGGASCDSLDYGTGALACASTCTFDTSGCSDAAVCGDGIVDAGEECDDGNNVSGDGCSPLCRFEALPGCGNGIMDAGEECDDGNNIGCDGCSPTCQQEGCGNGNHECSEECDDGNNVDCDGCSASCTAEVCGNGTLDCGETCDIGQVSSNCAAQGYAGGTLGCNGTCDGYDTSQCLRSDGQECTSNSQCVGNICYLESEGFPLGFCTTACVNDGSCTDGVCRDVPGGLRCYRTCTTSASCRPGYYCRIDPWDWNDLVCRPMCTSNTDCPITGMCNVYSGWCNEIASSTAGDNGEACNNGPDCKGVCWTDPPGGYCASECNMSNPDCQGDGVCSAIQGAGVGDLGHCLDGCQSSGDCGRFNYWCQSNPYGGAGNICLW